MKKNDSAIRAEVRQRGKKVLKSQVFRRIMKQKHHNGTVGAHSIGVAEDSMKIADALEKIGDKYNVRFVLSISEDVDNLPENAKKDVLISL